jgi:hypothetical protein
MQRLGFKHLTDLFPDHIQEECEEAFKEGFNERGGLEKGGHTEDEIRHDEADKAKHDFQRSRDQ